MTPTQRRNTILAALTFFARTDKSWIPDPILDMLATDGAAALLPEQVAQLVVEVRTADLILLTEDPVRHWQVLYLIGDDQKCCDVQCREGEIRATVEAWLVEHAGFDRSKDSFEIVEHLDVQIEEAHARATRSEQ